MKFVIQHVRGQREAYLSRLVSGLPDALVVECEGDAMETFLRSIVAADVGHWHFEDDVILCPDFLERARGLVERVGFGLIQAFSTGWEGGVRPGSSFFFTQCFWLPAGWGARIAEFAKTWPRRAEHPTGFDLLIRDWLVANRLHFWLEVPSLVQHAVEPSLLGPRSKYRQSPSFRAFFGEVSV